MFRFIRDLAIIDDSGNFEKTSHDIFPTESELKRENSINTETYFLDIEIKVRILFFFFI